MDDQESPVLREHWPRDRSASLTPCSEDMDYRPDDIHPCDLGKGITPVHIANVLLHITDPTFAPGE